MFYSTFPTTLDQHYTTSTTRPSDCTFYKTLEHTTLLLMLLQPPLGFIHCTINVIYCESDRCNGLLQRPQSRGRKTADINTGDLPRAGRALQSFQLVEGPTGSNQNTTDVLLLGTTGRRSSQHWRQRASPANPLSRVCYDFIELNVERRSGIIHEHEKSVLYICTAWLKNATQWHRRAQRLLH